MPPRPTKTAAAKSTTTTALTRVGAGVGHVLGPVTVAAPKNGAASKRRKDDYVEISSSSSEAEPGPAPPKSVARAKAGVPRLGLPKKNERAIPTTALPPPPPQTAAPPPPIPRVPASSAAPAPSNAQRPQSPNSRTRLATYPHEARVSRTQVEQEWTLVPPSGRRILRDQVEQIAEETLKHWGRKQSPACSRSKPPLSAEQLKSLRTALTDFANDFDQLLTGVPIPPLPGPLLTLDPNTIISRKKARLKGETGGDDRDWIWSLEALEAKIEDRV